MTPRCQPHAIGRAHALPSVLEQACIDEAPEAFSHLAQARRNGALGARLLTGRPKVLHRSLCV